GMTEMRELATGLQFPAGPVALPDGSVLVVEIRRGTLTRVAPDGLTSIVARTGGGPNGAAIGPDGKVYVCNNGGFEWHDLAGLTVPGNQPHDYSGGRIHPPAPPHRLGREPSPPGDPRPPPAPPPPPPPP